MNEMDVRTDDDAVRGAAISAFAKANKDIRLPAEAEGGFLESRRVEQRHGYWVAVTIRVTLGDLKIADAPLAAAAKP